jgi:protein-L-isoaspartate(D-aspartate) O-methyltransferase
MAAHGSVSPDAPRPEVGAEAARRELRVLASSYARARSDRWGKVPFEIDAAIAADVALAEAAFSARSGLLHEVPRRLGPFLLEPALVPRYLDALRCVPRERFVLPEDIALSADDAPLPLDREGLATVSAPHAYLLTYALLQLSEGDHLLELGTGTGYGAAIASEIVGPSGRVDSIEIDPDLAARALRLQSLLQGGRPRRITLYQGDACVIAPLLLRSLPEPRPPIKVGVTFALHAVPSALVAALPEGARLVAPVACPAEITSSPTGGADGDAGESDAKASRPPPSEGHADQDPQHLVLWEKRDGSIHKSSHGAVRYVTERH